MILAICTRPTALGFVERGSTECGSTKVCGRFTVTAPPIVGSTTLPITCLSQSFIPIGFAFIGSMSLGFTGIIGGWTIIGSSVSGVIATGGGNIGAGGSGGAG